MNRRPDTQLPAVRARRDDLPGSAALHLLSKGHSDSSSLATREHDGGALRQPVRPSVQPDPSRIEISFILFAAASDRPDPQIKCIAKLPGGFESYAQRSAPTSFSPEEMAAFLAALEEKARENLEWIVTDALGKLKKALGAE